MSTFCQRSCHRKCQRRGVGGQKKANNVVCEQALMVPKLFRTYFFIHILVSLVSPQRKRQDNLGLWRQNLFT
jgi:hypothetical protein